MTKSMLNTLAKIYQAAERANYETFEALGRFDNPGYAQQQAAHDATEETYHLVREALIAACIEYVGDEVDEGYHLFKRFRNPTSEESMQYLKEYGLT